MHTYIHRHAHQTYKCTHTNTCMHKQTSHNLCVKMRLYKKKQKEEKNDIKVQRRPLAYRENPTRTEQCS